MSCVCVRRLVEWSPVFLILGRHGRATLDQKAYYLWEPICRCAVQGCPLLIVSVVNICAMTDQKFRDVEVPALRRTMQCSITILCDRVHIGATIYQKLHDVGASISDRKST